MVQVTMTARKVEGSTSAGGPVDLRRLLRPGWVALTLLVIAAALGMARLGMWQLDRLEQRRLSNERVAAQMAAPPLAMNDALLAGAVSPQDLTGMEYRSVTVTGVYDPADEILLRNQVHENRPGFHLITPLRVEGTDAVVLVNRGFIPYQVESPAALPDLRPYAVDGPVTVRGVIRLPHEPRYFGAPDPALAPGETRRAAWNAMRMQRIQAQMPYTLLPVLVQAAAAAPQEVAPQEVAPQEVAADGKAQPVAQVEYPDLTDGSHLGYAAQWFTFAGLLVLGYPFFVKKQLAGPQRKGRKAGLKQQGPGGTA